LHDVLALRIEETQKLRSVPEGVDPQMAMQFESLVARATVVDVLYTNSPLKLRESQLGRATRKHAKGDEILIAAAAEVVRGVAPAGETGNQNEVEVVVAFVNSPIPYEDGSTRFHSWGLYKVGQDVSNADAQHLTSVLDERDRLDVQLLEALEIGQSEAKRDVEELVDPTVEYLENLEALHTFAGLPQLSDIDPGLAESKPSAEMQRDLIRQKLQDDSSKK